MFEAVTVGRNVICQATDKQFDPAGSSFDHVTVILLSRGFDVENLVLWTIKI